MMRSVKITRTRLDGSKTVKTAVVGQEAQIEEPIGEQSVIKVNDSTIINMPPAPADTDSGTVSMSPIKRIGTRITRNRQVEKIQEPTTVIDTTTSESPPAHTIVLKVGGIDVECRLMTTAINDLGVPDTVVGQCPVCTNKIEAPFPSDDDFYCKECGLGQPGKILEQRMTVIEPVSTGMMKGSDFGFDDHSNLEVKILEK